MRLLLDTHALLWALSDSPRLPSRWRPHLNGGSDLYLSAVSIWEISVKRTLGKLTAPDTLLSTAQQAGCRPLAITWDHGDRAGRLPPHHADPFDRLLIAQAEAEDLTLMTADSAFAAYGTSIL